MKIILSEKYGRLASWMRKLPAQGVCGEVLRNDRNTLWCERVAGEEFVVKRFAVPLRLNRWVYTFFRPTKARRSYDYSLRLRRSGIAVADPVGYIECRRGLLFHTGYYVSKRLPYPTLQQLDREPQARQFEILDAFAAFTVRLHEKGVLDYDYNPGNIFYYREDGAWNFALIDVNRMAFRRSSGVISLPPQPESARLRGDAPPPRLGDALSGLCADPLCRIAPLGLETPERRRTAQTGDQPAGTHPALFQTAHREEVAAGDAIIRPRSCIFGRRWDATAPVSVRRRPFRSPCRSTPDAA